MENLKSTEYNNKILKVNTVVDFEWTLIYGTHFSYTTGTRAGNSVKNGIAWSHGEFTCK